MLASLLNDVRYAVRGFAPLADASRYANYCCLAVQTTRPRIYRSR